MPRRGGSLRARALDWWQRSQADPERRAFRRIGIISFGALGGAVVLAKISQDAPAAGLIRALAITMFLLAAITLLAVVLLMGEEMVDAMDESDPMRARHGGAYGPRIKRYVRKAGRDARTWFKSLPGSLAALRHQITRESLSRFTAASAASLGGIPPADVPPPRSAGRLARPWREPPPPPEQAPPEPAPPARRVPASRSSRSGSPVVARRPINTRSSRTRLPPRRSEGAAPRTGRTRQPGGRSTR